MRHVSRETCGLEALQFFRVVRTDLLTGITTHQRAARSHLGSRAGPGSSWALRVLVATAEPPRRGASPPTPIGTCPPGASGTSSRRDVSRGTSPAPRPLPDRTAQAWRGQAPWCSTMREAPTRARERVESGGSVLPQGRAAATAHIALRRDPVRNPRGCRRSVVGNRRNARTRRTRDRSHRRVIRPFLAPPCAPAGDRCANPHHARSRGYAARDREPRRRDHALILDQVTRAGRSSTRRLSKGASRSRRHHPSARRDTVPPALGAVVSPPEAEAGQTRTWADGPPVAQRRRSARRRAGDAPPRPPRTQWRTTAPSVRPRLASARSDREPGAPGRPARAAGPPHGRAHGRAQGVSRRMQVGRQLAHPRGVMHLRFCTHPPGAAAHQAVTELVEHQHPTCDGSEDACASSCRHGPSTSAEGSPGHAPPAAARRESSVAPKVPRDRALPRCFT